MTGILFQYRVEVRILTYMKERNHFSGTYHGFSAILKAIEFCATHSPYDVGIQYDDGPRFKRDWVIEITLQDVILEMLAPAEWESLRKPEWEHPTINEGEK